MMENDKETGEAAASLMKQFIDTGYVTQGDDGSFTVPGISGQ